MKINSKDSFKSLKKLKVDNKNYNIFSLKEAEKNGLEGISKLPKSIKILLENLLRFEDEKSVKKEQILSIKSWLNKKNSKTEIAFRPARVLMQDYTGIPAVADLAAMRDAVKSKKKDPKKINPLSTVDLVIDHSVMVDAYASKDSFKKNVEKEFLRNGERYSFLKWGQHAFNNFRVVPPGTGICHQVNLEYLSKVVWSSENFAYPDTLVGTDSHTTMVNGLSVLGWGVGGIEAEAAMLGQPISMLIPEVIGVQLQHKLQEGTTATDLVLTIVQMLRKEGVVGKFVEFYGDGLKNLSLADRATIANMAPEYGATCGFFPVDEETIKYLKFSGRDQHTISLVEKYSKEQGLWADNNVTFTKILDLDLSKVVPSISGPKRPQDKVLLTESSKSFMTAFKENTNRTTMKEELVSDSLPNFNRFINKSIYCNWAYSPGTHTVTSITGMFFGGYIEEIDRTNHSELKFKKFNETTWKSSKTESNIFSDMADKDYKTSIIGAAHVPFSKWYGKYVNEGYYYLIAPPINSAKAFIYYPYIAIYNFLVPKFIKQIFIPRKVTRMNGIMDSIEPLIK